ncbi:Asporin [Manis pentadactyla]|nr:Asporin [Manis pentadactyla]
MNVGISALKQKRQSVLGLHWEEDDDIDGCLEKGEKLGGRRRGAKEGATVSAELAEVSLLSAPRGLTPPAEGRL